MNKLENLMDIARLNEFLGKKEEEEKKKYNAVLDRKSTRLNSSHMA